MNRSYKNIIINSAILLSSAAILEMALHELGHYLAAYFYNAKDLSLHHNYVQYNEDSIAFLPRIIIAASGPIISLLVGLAGHYIGAVRTKKDYVQLFYFFISAHGYLGFFGYLMIAPFFTYGDTGFIFDQFGFPVWLTIIIAVIGVFALFLILKNFSRYFVALGDKLVIDDFAERKKITKAILLYPLFLSIAITALLNLPVPTPLSLIAPLTSPFALMWIDGGMLNKKISVPFNPEFDKLNKIHTWIIILFVITIILNRFLVPVLSSIDEKRYNFKKRFNYKNPFG